MHCFQIKNFKMWRKHARDMLSRSVPPELISWNDSAQAGLPFAFSNGSSQTHSNKSFRVPSEFIQLSRAVACFRDDKKWSLLYSVLWRLTYETPHLLRMVTDTEVKQLINMRKAVNRDVHKMHAFVRFKESSNIDGQTHYIAWFEPTHLIVEYTANFFVNRFTNMHWSILTPDACAHWNQKKLSITAGTTQSVETIVDDMEQCWQQYYRSIFNPARLKEKAMQSEMPKKYWQHLPESRLIPELTRTSTAQMQNMLERTPTDPQRLRKKSTRLKQQQDGIRLKNKKNTD